MNFHSKEHYFCDNSRLIFTVNVENSNVLGHYREKANVLNFSKMITNFTWRLKIQIADII